MRIQYGKVSVGVEEVFFYDPKGSRVNICTMCVRKDCSVPDKEIVLNCNSYRHPPPKVTDTHDIATEYRIIQGMTLSNDNFAYVSNIASTS